MDQAPDVRPDHWRTTADRFSADSGGSQLQSRAAAWTKATTSHSRPSRSLIRKRTKCAKWRACHVYEATALHHVGSQSVETKSSGLSNDPEGLQTHARAAMEQREAVNVLLLDQHVPTRPRRARSVVASADVMSKGGIAA